jgi:flagellar hook-associated protein 2
LAGETIEQVVDKINAAGINVTASLEDDNAGGFKLVYQSSNDYGNHQVAITSADASMSKLLKSHEYANFTENTAASKAQITLNGSIVVTSETNTFENAVAGLSLEVKKAHDATASDNIKINLDKGSTEEAVKKFVESYNEMFAVVAELTQVNEDGTAGQLVGDSTIRTMMNQLRGALGGIVTIDKFSTQSLASIGIKTERDGTLSLNEATLTKQLNSNFEQFGALFAGDEGIGKALSNVVSEYKGIGGIVESKIKSATSSIDRINEERTDFDERMGRYEARLFSQFTTMDLLVSQLQATGDYLTAQLDALSGINKKK